MEESPAAWRDDTHGGESPGRVLPYDPAASSDCDSRKPGRDRPGGSFSDRRMMRVGTF
jgi:hypothetical protein